MRHAGDGLFIIFCFPLPAPMALAEPNAEPRVIMETNYNRLIPGSGVMKTDAAATRKGAASK